MKFLLSLNFRYDNEKGITCDKQVMPFFYAFCSELSALLSAMKS